MVRNILNELTARGVRHLIVSTLFFVIYALCGTAIMLTVLFLIDRHIQGESISLISAAWILGGLLVLKTISNAIADMSKHFAGFDLVERIREKIILKLKKFSLGFYTNERLGEISTIIHKDVDNMEMVVGHLWTRMSADFIVALILGIGLFCVDWRMGLAMIAILPVALFSLYQGIRSGMKAQQEAQDGLADMVSLFVEYVKGIPVLKIFGGKGMFRDRLDRSVSEFGESSKKTSRLAAVSVGRYTFLIELAFALMATLGLWWTWRGELSLFAYLMFVIVSKEFYKPFVNMESHWLNYIKVKDSYERISRLLDAPEIVDPDQPKTAERFDLSFENIGFHYEKKGFKMKDLTRTDGNGSCRLVRFGQDHHHQSTAPLLGTTDGLYPYRRSEHTGNGLRLSARQNQRGNAERHSLFRHYRQQYQGWQPQCHTGGNRGSRTSGDDTRLHRKFARWLRNDNRGERLGVVGRTEATPLHRPCLPQGCSHPPFGRDNEQCRSRQ